MRLSKQQGDDVAFILEQVLDSWDFSGDNIDLGKRLERLLGQLQDEVK